VVVGRPEWVRAMASSPIARVVRVDKLTLAALEATLRLYGEEDVWSKVPTLRAIAVSPLALRLRARRVARRLRGRVGSAAEGGGIRSVSQVGGGSFPDGELPTWVVWVAPRSVAVADLAQRLRQGWPAIVGRVGQGRLLLDLRTVLEEEEPVLIEGILDALRL